MKITVLCVGKIKEGFYRDAVQEYLKRISRYAKIDIVEVHDEKTPEGASEAQMEIIKDTEGRRILAKIPPDSYVITLEIQGEAPSSEEFAARIAGLALQGESHLCFIIGGSLGLSRAVTMQADSRISFSRMTFPHQLMRVILLEQIYRACKINHHEPYHK